MLILTRKPTETIKIADNVDVVVLSVKGDRVRIGINAPKNVPIHRSEIYQLIKSQSEDKVTTVNDDGKKPANA